MRSRMALAATASGAICLIGAAVMGVASFLPYTGGNWGDGLLSGNQVSSQVTMSIVSGSDAWFVLGTVITLGVVAYHLRGRPRPATGFVALAASLVALGLALKLPGTWKQDGVVYGEPYLLYAGYYAFLSGAVIAVVGAFPIVIIGFTGLRTKTATPLRSPY